MCQYLIFIYLPKKVCRYINNSTHRTSYSDGEHRCTLKNEKNNKTDKSELKLKPF